LEEVLPIMVREGLLWRLPKKKGHLLLRVVGKEEEKQDILHELHDANMARHKGREATYERI